MSLVAVDHRFRTDRRFRLACAMLHKAKIHLVECEAEIRRRLAIAEGHKPMTIAEFQAKHGKS